MKHSTVSIIVPIYNSEKWLAKCLDSIIVQTYPYWECILVDDASKDNSKKVIASYLDKDSRFRSISLPTNGGVSNARNKGLDDAKGSFVSFIDSDDCIAPTFLERLVNTAKCQHTKIVACASDVTKTNGKKCQWFKGDGLRTVKDLCTIGPDIAAVTNCLYAKEATEGIHFDGFKYAEDLLFNWKILDRVGEVFFIPDVLYHHEEQPSGLSKTVDMFEIRRVYNWVTKSLKSPNIDIYVENLKKRRYFRDLY